MSLKSSTYCFKKGKKLGKISYVVKDRKSSNFGSKKGKKIGQYSYVVRDRKSSNFDSKKKTEKIGQDFIYNKG